VAHTDASGTFISSQRRDSPLAILPKPRRSHTEAAQKIARQVAINAETARLIASGNPPQADITRCRSASDSATLDEAASPRERGRFEPGARDWRVQPLKSSGV
jgi:hypothetical protein